MKIHLRKVNFVINLPAFRDHIRLTRLPNRQRFKADYRPGAGMHLVMITLSGANAYNRLLRAIGHDHADEFVRVAAARLRETVGGGRGLYHVALMSFVFLRETSQCEPLLRDIIAAFDQPIFCAGIPVLSDIAIGLTACDEADPGVILRAALAAAQDCRAQSMGWAYYNPQSDKANQRGFMLLSALSTALTVPGELRLNFQPKYDLASGRMTSAEALLRWEHPTLGSISPAEFIPLSETTTHIHALTDWVMGEALRHAVAWRDSGAQIRLAINVSPRNLARAGFARRTIDQLAQHGIAGASIELEFTEGLLMSNDQVVTDELRQLRAAGIHIALDDFGTGFANFSYITHLPADIIKIDKSFIMAIGNDERVAVVVQAIVELAHRLGYAVVSEGIETREAYDMLAAGGVIQGQGFLLSRPLDGATFAATLATQVRPVSLLNAAGRSGSRAPVLLSNSHHR
jgi:EAL domain-containing protein (putative c-di-GMP-specific phosphodiesterase class I)